MTVDSERDLFERKLQELYAVERRLDDVQARFADEVIDEDLEEFFMGHHRATGEQLERVEGLFEEVNAEPDAEPLESEALEGIVDEHDRLLADLEAVGLRSVADAEAARAIERTEITLLETLLTLSDRMTLGSAVDEPLRRSKTEAENALERLHELPIATEA